MPEALAQSLGAGLDVEMGGHILDTGKGTTPTSDALDPARVDDAVRRILRLKHAFGLFDNPFVDPVREVKEHSTSSRLASRGGRRESLVLPKNASDLLPLRAEA